MNAGSDFDSALPLRSGCRAKNTRFVSASTSLVPLAIACRTVVCSGDCCSLNRVPNEAVGTSRCRLPYAPVKMKFLNAILI